MDVAGKSMDGCWTSSAKDGFPHLDTGQSLAGMTS
jgi:hypothetical protein